MVERPDKFETLARLARQEAPPSVDVAGRVIAILAAGQPVAPMYRGLAAAVCEKFWMWIAAAASAVAVPAAVLALATYASWSDPLTEIFTEISWVMR